MTGLHPSAQPHGGRFGIRDWIPADSRVQLRKSEITFAKLLKEAGYERPLRQVAPERQDGRHQPKPGDHGYEHWMATQNNASPSHKIRTTSSATARPSASSKGILHPARGRGGRVHRERPGRSRSRRVWPSTPRTCRSAVPGGSRSRYPRIPRTFGLHGNMTWWTTSSAGSSRRPSTSRRSPTRRSWYSRGQRPGEGAAPGGRAAAPAGAAGRKRHMTEGGIRVPGIVRWPGQGQPGHATADAPVVGALDFPPILGI